MFSGLSIVIRVSLAALKVLRDPCTLRVLDQSPGCWANWYIAGR